MGNVLLRSKNHCLVLRFVVIRNVILRLFSDLADVPWHTVDIFTSIDDKLDCFGHLCSLQ